MFVCAYAELLCLHKHVNCVFTGRCVHEREGEREFFIMLLVGPMPTVREGILMIRRSVDQTLSSFAFLVTVGSALICYQEVRNVVVSKAPFPMTSITPISWLGGGGGGKGSFSTYNGWVCTSLIVDTLANTILWLSFFWPVLVYNSNYRPVRRFLQTLFRKTMKRVVNECSCMLGPHFLPPYCPKKHSPFVSRVLTLHLPLYSTCMHNRCSLNDFFSRVLSNPDRT